VLRIKYLIFIDMSNRNFDSRVIIQRLQNQVYSRNLYSNNATGQSLINNPQNSDGNASRFNSYVPGAQTEYFRGLVGAGETISPGGIINIPAIVPTPTPTPTPSQVPGSMSFNSNLPSSVKYTNSNSLTIGSDSFTIEWYQYWESGADFPRAFSIGTYPDAYLALSYELYSNTYLWTNGNGNLISTIPSLNSWAHIAIVGTSGVGIKVYFDGLLVSDIAGGYNITNDITTELTIGNETNQSNESGYTGLITNFRWVVGTAVYTSNFVPPSVPLTNISGTELLLLVSSEPNLVVDSSTANRTPTNQNVTYSTSLPPPFTYTFITNGLTLYYNFGDVTSYPGTGTSVTNLGSVTNTGTLVNGPIFSSSWEGVIGFDGSNDYINTNASFASESFTINSWFRASTDVSVPRALISKEQNVVGGAPWNYRIYLNITTGYLIGDIAKVGSSASIANTTNLADNNWHLASFSRNATTNIIKLYVDGILVDELADGLTGTIINAQDVWIGRSALSGGRYPFLGNIGSAFIYNRALTDNEVFTDYNATKSRFFGLTSSYLPNLGTTSSWTASVGNLDATMTGTPTYSSSLGYTFDGTTQYGRIASSDGINNFSNTNDYTVEIWFNPSSGQPSASVATILEKWNSTNQPRYPYVFRYAESATRIQIAAFDGTNNPTISIIGINTNTWVQIVGVFDFTNDLMTVYKNGSSVNTLTLAPVGNVSNTSQLAIAHRIGTNGTTPEFMFKGSIGLIRIYNTALSSSQVLANFNLNKTTFGL